MLVQPGEPVDRVLMNPPFAKGADMAHVRKAFNHVKASGRQTLQTIADELNGQGHTTRRGAGSGHAGADMGGDRRPRLSRVPWRSAAGC